MQSTGAEQGKRATQATWKVVALGMCVVQRCKEHVSDSLFLPLLFPSCNVPSAATDCHMQTRAHRSLRSNGCKCGATLRHVRACDSSYEVSVRPTLAVCALCARMQLPCCTHAAVMLHKCRHKCIRPPACIAAHVQSTEDRSCTTFVHVNLTC